MTRTNLVARSLNDLGGAAWFGGLLVQAVGAPGGDGDPARTAPDDSWRRWWPLEAAAVTAHVVGGALLTVGNRERVVLQRGVLSLSVVKTAVMATAVAGTAYSAWLARRPTTRAGADDAGSGAPRGPESSSQRQQRVLRWTLPALTGALVVLNAAQGEQQRPSHVARGVLRRLDPTA